MEPAGPHWLAAGRGNGRPAELILSMIFLLNAASRAISSWRTANLIWIPSISQRSDVPSLAVNHQLGVLPLLFCPVDDQESLGAFFDGDCLLLFSLNSRQLTRLLLTVRPSASDDERQHERQDNHSGSATSAYRHPALMPRRDVHRKAKESVPAGERAGSGLSYRPKRAVPP